MSVFIAASKRLAVLFYSSFLLVQASPVGYLVSRWGHYWIANSSKILTLTTINTSMTFGFEFISRTVLAHSVSEGPEYQFVVNTPDNQHQPWFKKINRQSLINIWMTFFASMLGAPVYFFRNRRNRFLFFVGFGCFNSWLSQGVLSLLKDGILIVAGSRLLFDFFYNGTVKFLMFEFYRRPINEQKGLAQLYFLRGKQDLLTSLIKNFILNSFRFKG